MDEAIEFANDQMDQKLIIVTERQAKQKRKLEYNAGNNQGHQQQNKRQNTRRAYTAGPGSGYHQKDRKPSQNDKTEHGMEKTVQNQGQSPKMSKSESIQKNQQSNRSRN
ncbi:hypothetical protein Tco_0617744 [Tanacetum coccineum]